MPGAAGVAALAHELEAMGVAQTVIVTEKPKELRRASTKKIDVVGLHDLGDPGEGLADMRGVTVLIHDRACALERPRAWRRCVAAPHERLMISRATLRGLRRLRRQGQLPLPRTGAHRIR